MKTSISISILLVMLLSGCYRAVQISLSQSGMAPCPDSPNCVSSLSENTRHKIEPFPLHISAGQSLNTLRQIIASMERTEILWMSDRSLLATFTTKMGFVDDVQVLIDESRRVIHVRAADAGRAAVGGFAVDAILIFLGLITAVELGLVELEIGL